MAQVRSTCRAGFILGLLIFICTIEAEEDFEGTVTIIVEELVERIACENGETKIRVKKDQSRKRQAELVSPTRKKAPRICAYLSPKKLEKVDVITTDKKEMNMTTPAQENMTNLQNDNSKIAPLLHDPSLPKEVRDALLQQSQQLMMYSNAFNTLVMQQQQQQQLQQLVSLQNQLSAANPQQSISFLQAPGLPRGMQNNLNLTQLAMSRPYLNAQPSLSANTQMQINQGMLAHRLHSTMANRYM